MTAQNSVHATLPDQATLKHTIIKYLLIGLVASIPVLLYIATYTNWDLAIEDYYYDGVTKKFPWGNAWLTTAFAHGYVKNVFVDFGLLILSIALVDLIFRFSFISDFVRYRLRFVAVASLVVPFAIRTIKRHSAMHCPWDVDRYGGYAPYLRLLDPTPANWHAGYCFPTGHASTGLWLASLAVFWLPHAPKKALMVFLGGLGIGFALGWTQQMRGAHFLTHTLWALWVTTLIIGIMFWLSSKYLMQAPIQR